MAFAPGTRVILESESVSRSPRTGMVEEVMREDPSPRYRIRWDDGHETIHTPASGALRVARPRTSTRRQKPSRRAGGHDRKLG
jgi:hypothetical protein